MVVVTQKQAGGVYSDQQQEGDFETKSQMLDWYNCPEMLDFCRKFGGFIDGASTSSEPQDEDTHADPSSQPNFSLGLTQMLASLKNKGYSVGKKHNPKKDRQAIQLHDVPPFWKTKGLKMDNVTEKERMLSDYVFGIQDDIETLFEIPEEVEKPTIPYIFFVQRSSFKTMAPGQLVDNM
ncbi:OLC1v1030095C1 [Oldenlandia corymbosa var. corymbosa]|uniref:OLC1v1030095C1 n=1 Tax=Oldenlandia corymbosa var. corymbosa TaxID=529605 RepID=A0AAV1CG23_OLDCO|nr:OLC1v1030095C1 [Oldenlandia corymbosa var. corymbosa]